MGFSASGLAQTSLALQGAGAAASTVGSIYGAIDKKSALSADAEIATLNARMSETAAQQELAKGQAAVAALTARAGRLKSAQRVSLAANGVDLGVGSASEVLASTDLLKEEDADQAYANAVRAAWGYRMQGTNFENQASMARATADSISPGLAGATSLLGSAGQVSSSWYAFKKAGAV